MEIKLKTLTPIWTGGVETSRMDRLHETGLIGSLRWWYEAIVRGLGGRACDPTEHSCIYDPEKANSLCDACRVFGATGWRRRFRLVVQETQMQPQQVPHRMDRMEADRSYKDSYGKDKIPTWYFKNPPQEGDFSVQLLSLAPQFSVELIQGLIQLAVDWTALGARTQMGFGVTELVGERLTTNPFNDLQLTGSGSSSKLPSLQNMFLARIQQAKATDRETFNLKYDLRRLFAHEQFVRHFVMGTVRGDRKAAKIHMSRPYADGIIRVWGWVPNKADVWNNKWNRDNVLIQIKSHLVTNYQLRSWREFNNSRDTNQQYTDARAFLHSLWEGKE